MSVRNFEAKLSPEGEYAVIVGILNLDFAIHVEADAVCNIYVKQNSCTDGFATTNSELTASGDYIVGDATMTSPSIWASTDNFLNCKVVDVLYGVLLPCYLKVSSNTSFHLYLNTQQSGALKVFCNN